MISGRDDLISGRDVLISGSDELISGCDELISGSDVLISGRDELISGCDELILGRDDLISGRDVLISGNDDLISGCDVLISGSDVLISGNDELTPGNAVHRYQNGSFHPTSETDSPPMASHLLTFYSSLFTPNRPFPLPFLAPSALMGATSLRYAFMPLTWEQKVRKTIDTLPTAV